MPSPTGERAAARTAPLRSFQWNRRRPAGRAFRWRVPGTRIQLQGRFTLDGQFGEVGRRVVAREGDQRNGGGRPPQPQPQAAQPGQCPTPLPQNGGHLGRGVGARHRHAATAIHRLGHVPPGDFESLIRCPMRSGLRTPGCGPGQRRRHGVRQQCRQGAMRGVGVGVPVCIGPRAWRRRVAWSKSSWSRVSWPHSLKSGRVSPQNVPCGPAGRSQGVRLATRSVVTGGATASECQGQLPRASRQRRCLRPAVGTEQGPTQRMDDALVGRRQGVTNFPCPSTVVRETVPGGLVTPL